MNTTTRQRIGRPHRAAGMLFGVLAAAAAIAACGKPEKAAAPAKPDNKPAAEAQAPSGPPTYPEVEALRNSVPGGQVLLADDAAFSRGVGWWQAEYNPTPAGMQVCCWTRGSYQILDWEGPEAPGEYDLRVEFWRHQPIPEEVTEVEYLLPGATEKQTVKASVGQFLIEGRIKTTTPREKLHLELKIPSWIPKDHIPGSSDPRELGMIFSSLKLIPAAAAESAPAADGAAPAAN